MPDLYDLGERPPLGLVPKQMHAYAVRQNRFGQHTYTLEEFGLHADAIRARLSDYLDRYGSYV